MKILPLTALALSAISGAGFTYWKAPLGSEREATRRIYRRALERAIDREHQKVLQVDLFVDHSDWSTAVEISSQFYTVKTTNPAHGRNIGQSLDRQLLKLQELLGTKYTPPRRFPIWILPTVEEYSNLGEGSDEHSSFYASYYSPGDSGRPVICLYNLNRNVFDVLHSAVHQYVDAAFPRRLNKTWVSEGLAHYLCLDVSNYFREWARDQHLQKQSRYTPLRNLIRQNGLDAYGDSRQAEVRLLQLALFFRFLLEELPDTARGNPEPDDSFANYLRSVMQGREPRNGFAATFMNDRGLRYLDQTLREFRFE